MEVAERKRMRSEQLRSEEHIEWVQNFRRTLTTGDRREERREQI
jgi:hypothetical protein